MVLSNSLPVEIVGCSVGELDRHCYVPAAEQVLYYEFYRYLLEHIFLEITLYFVLKEHFGVEGQFDEGRGVFSRCYGNGFGVDHSASPLAVPPDKQQPEVAFFFGLPLEETLVDDFLRGELVECEFELFRFSLKVLTEEEKVVNEVAQLIGLYLLDIHASMDDHRLQKIQFLVLGGGVLDCETQEV